MKVWKKPHEITLDDIPCIESPFFAAHSYSDPALNTLGNSVGYSYSYNSAETTKQRKKQVLDGEYLLVCFSEPFSSPFTLEKTADGKQRWVLSGYSCDSASFNLQSALDYAYFNAHLQACAAEAESQPQGHNPCAVPTYPFDGFEQTPDTATPAGSADTQALTKTMPAAAALAAAPAAADTPAQDQSAQEKTAICELIYMPDQDLVIVLTPEELTELEQQEQITDELARRILGAQTAEQLRQAKLDLSQFVNDKILIKPLVKGSPADFVEIHRLGQKKWSYAPRDLIDKFKKGGEKSFSLRQAAPSSGEPQPAAGPEQLRTKDGKLQTKEIKRQFCKISVKIKEKWDIVKPESGRFSIRSLIETAAGITVANAIPATVFDKLDQWIAALNKNMQWRTSQKQRDCNHILKLLEKQAIDQPWYKPWIRADDADRRYRIFDEDDLGLTQDTVERIWGDDPGQADWVRYVGRITFDELDRNDLAGQIRSRPLPDSFYSADAAAQLMRYTYGITAAVEFDVPKGKLAAKANAELDLALFEGKAGGDLLLPDPKGLNIDIPMIRKDYQNQYKPIDRAGTPNPLFDFNKTFLTVDAMQTITAAFGAWYAHSEQQLIPRQKGPARKLQLTGHADRPGPEPYNQTLSQRRASVVYGYLTHDPEPWLAMFTIPETNGGWGPTERDAMLNALGYTDPGPAKAIARFQNEKGSLPIDSGNARHLVPTGKIDTAAPAADQTLDKLIHHYMALGNLTNPVRHEYFLDPPYLGAGESQPVTDIPGPARENRRVSWAIHELAGVNETREEKEVPLGALRFAVAAHIGGFIGANLMAGADIHFDINPKGATAKEKGRLLARGVDNIDQGGKAGASAFFGAKGEVGIKGALQWKPPESSDGKKENKFLELGSVGYTMIGELGLELTADVQIGYDNFSKKFLIKAKAAAALGPGYGGKLAFTVGVKHTYNFITMVYSKLRENDFSFLDFFEESEEVNVFDLFCSWSYQMLLKGDLVKAGALGVGAVGAKVMGEVAEMTKIWKESWEELQHARQLIENINENAEMLRYTTPEVKGRILYLLILPGEFANSIQTYFHNFGKDRKKAVDTVLSWIQSKRHCREVLEHMGVNIPKGDDINDKALRVEQNKDYIIEYLKGLDVTTRQWADWYNNLPDSIDASGSRTVTRGKSPMGYVKKMTGDIT